MNYDSYTREELIEQLKMYREGPYAAMYRAGLKQLSKIAKEFEDSKIDIKSENGDKLFMNFIVFFDRGGKIADNLEDIQKKIDPVIVSKIKKQVAAAEDFSPEAIAKKNASK